MRREVRCLILAAGAGTRMKSDLAKVLHLLAGRPLVDYVVEAAQRAGMARPMVVIGHQADKVRQALAGRSADFVLQAEQKGTGHAVMQAEPLLRDFDGDLLVLYGDVPLINPKTIVSLIAQHQSQGNACTMLTTVIEDPGSYGRVIRDRQGLVSRIVEARDATPEELEVKEINPAIYCFDNRILLEALRRVRPDNDQGEYYLTDVIGIMKAKGLPVAAVVVTDSREVLGINTQDELRECQDYLQKRLQ
jgi:bifunctional UDP-N-acetylglucosamine pyrophosphorylase/glucosamine-1-phosphate N-acetyltransferase